jgi:hypothetical protein
MYAWIWRHLPYGLPGKLTGSVLLFAGAVSLLWFWGFPAISPWLEDYLLPFDQSTIEFGPSSGGGVDTDSGTVGDTDPGADDPAGEFVGPDGEPLDPHDIPYSTDD